MMLASVKPNLLMKLKKIEITGDRSKQKHLDLSEEELKSFRALIGQLLWASNQTHPDISFNLSELSNSVNHATVEHILSANRVLKNAQNKLVTLTFPYMENLMQCKLVAYSYASYNNLENGSSQGGFCIFLKNSYGNLSLIMWQSKKIHRIVKSTMAAETLALVDAAEASCWLSNLISELLSYNENVKIHLPTACFTNNRQLYHVLRSIRPALDKRLRVEIRI